MREHRGQRDYHRGQRDYHRDQRDYHREKRDSHRDQRSDQRDQNDSRDQRDYHRDQNDSRDQRDYHRERRDSYREQRSDQSDQRSEKRSPQGRRYGASVRGTSSGSGPRRPRWLNFLEDRYDEEGYERQRRMSREREFRRQVMQYESIRKVGGYARLAEREGEGRSPVRLYWDGFQWIAKTGQEAGDGDAALLNQTRKQRRLYFGNLPMHFGLTEISFQEMIWREMVKRSLADGESSNPVVCVWFAKDKGTYGFVEFARPEEADSALSLDGMVVMGVPIKVSRPNDYANAAASIQPTGFSRPNEFNLRVPPSSAGNTSASVTQRLDPVEVSSTSYLLLKHMVNREDIDQRLTWAEALEDVLYGCEKHGEVKFGMVCSPNILAAVKSKDLGIHFLTLGDVVIEFETPAVSECCLQGLTNARYFGRLVVPERLTCDKVQRLHEVVIEARILDEGIVIEAS